MDGDIQFPSTQKITAEEFQSQAQDRDLSARHLGFALFASKKNGTGITNSFDYEVLA